MRLGNMTKEQMDELDRKATADMNNYVNPFEADYAADEMDANYEYLSNLSEEDCEFSYNEIAEYHGFSDNGHPMCDDEYVATATYRHFRVVFEHDTEEGDGGWLATAYRIDDDSMFIGEGYDPYECSTLAEVADDFAECIDYWCTHES